MEVTGLDDVVVKFNQEYSIARAMGKKGRDVFDTIVAGLFSKYGERLGYSDPHLFKGDLVLVKNNMKKTKKFRAKKIRVKKFLHEMFFGTDEGDGQGFTANQVEKLGLDPNSYY